MDENFESFYEEDYTEESKDNFGIGVLGDEEREGGEGKEYVKEKELVWEDVIEKRRYKGERYEDEFHKEEEVGEADEEEEVEVPLSPTVSATEKLEEEVRQIEESDHVLAEIPAEILADREVMVAKLKELLNEQTELRRRNKLLELWVSRYMRKAQQKVTPMDTSTDPAEMEQIYKQVLRTYKVQVDEVTFQQTRLTFETQYHKHKVQTMQDKNDQVFNEYLDLLKKTAVGLVYAKTGRKITENIANEMIHRQISRREILARDRLNYILLQQRAEDLNARLRNLETLGEGMSTMDYEALRIAGIGYKDKLDERDQELEKLRFKIAEVVNGVAHYKEKEVCLAEDIEYEEQKLNEHRERAAKVREHVNWLHMILRNLRQTYNGKKFEAGLLMAQPVLREMEKTMKLLDALKNDIEIIEHEIRQYVPPDGKKKKKKKKKEEEEEEETKKTGKDGSEIFGTSAMTQDKLDRF